MTLPLIEDLCSSLDIAPLELCITLPGNAKICAIPNIPYPDLTALAMEGLSQLSTALAPLQPVFDIIETINAVFKCIDAIVGGLNETPPDPLAALDCLPNLRDKILALLNLLPPLTIPQLIKDALGVLITFLNAMIAQIDSLIRLEASIFAASKLVALSPGLFSAIDCGNANIINGMNNISRLIGNINILIELLNRFGSIVGLPEIPTFEGGLTGAALGPAKEAMEIVRDALVSIRDLIVVPGDNLGDLLLDLVQGDTASLGAALGSGVVGDVRSAEPLTTAELRTVLSAGLA